MRPNVDVLWSPEALQDLVDIWRYFAKLASAEFADNLLTEIRDAESLIVDNPHGWRERTELLRGIRGFPIRPYTIFYRVSDGIPEVVRVLHERRDIGHLFARPEH
jgi:toxin ParE1/3/4